MFRTLRKKIIKKNRSKHSINPEDIFVDSENLPAFDQYQCEGRLEHPLSKKSIIGVVIIFILLGCTYSFQIWNLQIKKGEAYANQSENNRLRHSLVFAERGNIYDNKGTPLVWNIPAATGADFSERAYTTRKGFGNLLGYVKYPKKDNSGFYYEESFTAFGGVEEYYNDIIGGINGLKIVETNAVQEIVGNNTIAQPQAGNNLSLTVDADLQETLYESIEEIADQVGFIGGAGIIMDVHTGEVIAMTSYPEYDPNILTKGVDQEAIAQLLADPQHRFLNRATKGLYTPGSILKPFVALGALQEDVVTSQTSVLSTKEMVVPNPYDPSNPSYFSDWKAHGMVNVRQALAFSSNIYFYQVGGGYEPTGQNGIGITKLESYFKKFGFGSRINDDLLGGPSGTIPNPKWKEEMFNGEPWRLGDTYFTAIGQYGVQVTPMQVVRAVAALANGGKLLQPTVRSDDSIFVVRTIDGVDEKNFAMVRSGMRDAVEFGTARGLDIPEINVAAKTGTAELGVSKERVNSWVIGFYPYEKPQYAFVIMMEQGSRTNLIGGVAVMRKVFDWMRVYRPELLGV